MIRHVHLSVRAQTAAVALVTLVTAPMSAQQRAPDASSATRIAVGVFKSLDKTSGVQAADAIRTRLADEYPVKQLYVLPKQDNVNVLVSSGFAIDEALAPNDAKALAQQLRTDAYVVGTIQREGTGYRVDANYVLTRDNTLVQPLPTIRVAKPDQAAGPLVKAFRDAHKQFAAEKACYVAARANKLPDAIAAARKGITEYPQATLARICLANALVASSAPADSVIAVTDEILRIYAKSVPALTLKYDVLKRAGKNDDAIDVLLVLAAADPTDTRRMEQVINDLAQQGHAAKAIPLVDRLVENNTGDPGFLQLQMRVHLAAQDYKGGIAAGEALTKADTSFATAELFGRLAAAASIDGRIDKAKDLLARGIAKFPTNADLIATDIAVLQKAGDLAAAVEVIDRAITADVKVPALRTQQAKLRVDLDQLDGVMESLAAAAAANEDPAGMATTALYAAQSVQKRAAVSKSISDYQKALGFIEYAIKTYSTPDAVLRHASLELTIGATYLSQAQTQSSARGATKAQLCTMSKAGQDALIAAQIDLPQIGRANVTAAQTLASQLTQYSGYADQMTKAYCSAK